jgi:hypothetical protein
MPTVEATLFAILADLVENLEWAVREIQRLRGAVRTVPTTREPYLAGVGLKDDDVRQRSIRELRQRVDAIRRKLPK